MSEQKPKYKCTKCRWIGFRDEMTAIPYRFEESDVLGTQDVCPKCGNNEFYYLGIEEVQS